MDIYASIAAMKPFITRRDWDGLEAAYRGTCVELAGRDQAMRISALDFPGYGKALATSFAEAAARLAQAPARALYFEYDLDNGWDGTLFLCPAYQPEPAGDEDWACDWVDEVGVPGFPEASALYRENHFDRTPKAKGSTLYLVARTVAAFGRCAGAADTGATAICIGFHDQTPVTRIREPT